MDSPNVNLKVFKDFVENRTDRMIHALLDIGSCSLHIIHGRFKTGAEKSGWEVKRLLKVTFQVLHNSPARREDYESVTASTKYLSYFCPNR